MATGGKTAAGASTGADTTGVDVVVTSMGVDDGTGGVEVAAERTAGKFVSTEVVAGLEFEETVVALGDGAVATGLF